MKALHELDRGNFFQPFKYCFWRPFVIAFLLYCISLTLEDSSKHFIVHAISGFYSTILTKLFMYSSSFMLGMATLLYRMPLFPKVLRWSGDHLALLAFDYSLAVNGVVLGIFSAMALIKKDFSPFGATLYVVSLMTLLQFDLWFLSYLASGKVEKIFKWSRSRTASCCIASIIVLIVVVSFCLEPWNELNNKANQMQQSTIITETK
jgi:hypothetical protein